MTMKRNDAVEAAKSVNDKKQYRLLTLSNELQVLLISTVDVPHVPGEDQDGSEAGSHDRFSDTGSELDDDDDDDSMSGSGAEDDSDDSASSHSDAFGAGEHGPPGRRAGACLTVGVGSFAEPETLPGLAHYLEHMLFMGSAKYPNENEFESFLSSHGGFSNGATDNEITSYTFEVGPTHLETALDMFAHFFISPLMKAETMERELSAIESEFNQAVQNDRVRLQQVLSATTPKTHPYHRFSWGNCKSLKDLPEQQGVDVRPAIVDFYEHNYSANIMKLVVSGDNSLDDLERWVSASFSQIPNKNVPERSFASYGQPFGATVDAKPMLCRIVPVRDIHTLHLNWMIPSTLGLHRQKPADYIASLMGHESEGSILAHLKRRGWISALTAGVTESDGYECGTFAAKFDVTMKVTESGIAHWEDIVHAVFEYLTMLRTSKYPDWVFEELKAISDISFRFMEETSAVENCEELAEIMQGIFKVAPEDLLRYELFQGDFQRELVEQAMTHFTPENLRVAIMSSTTTQQPDFESKVIEEEWFGVKYTTETISDATIERWSKAGLNAELHLQTPNPFIPRDFTLLDPNAHEFSSERTKFGQMWYKPDRAFATPRAHIAFLVHLPSVMQNVAHFVWTELYVKLVRDALNAYAYHANVAELTYGLSVKESGFELLIGGFNDKLMNLVEIVVKALFSTPIDPSRFAVIKQDMLRECRNSIMKPAHKAKHLRLQVLERLSFPLDQMISTLDNTTVEDLSSFTTEALWNSRAMVRCFAHGNITPATAALTLQLVENQIERVTSPLAFTEMCHQLVNEIPQTLSGLLLNEPSELDGEVNTHVELYYQIGGYDLKSLAYADLLHQLMEEPLFDTLRTKQELGYDVSCIVRMTHGILGYGVMVQSSLFSAEYIADCIDRFMADFEEAIELMPDEHFHDHVQAQILKKLEPDHNLSATTHRYWYEITSGRLNFDIDEQLAKQMESCTKAEMVHHYRKWILHEPRKLSVHVIGRNSQAEKQQAKDAVRKHSSGVPPPINIKDLYAFKAELRSYPPQARSPNDEKDGDRKCL